MTSLQGFISQDNNKIEAGGITFSIDASDLPIRVYPTIKSGNGTVGAYGNHSGPNDATYQIRISSETGNPIPTAPIFKGVGSGELQNFRVRSSITNQKIQLICKDIGIDSEYATVNLDGILYRFKTKSSAGNDLYITIDETNLIFTDSEKTLITELSVGDTGLEGPEWDFSTPPIEGDIVPISTYGRIAFGEDRINIYQQYKVFENNTWVYYYIRPIQRDVRAGVPVYYVTGYRVITITDGSSTSETFSNIVTSADFYQAIKGEGIWAGAGASDLIEPVLTSIDLQRHVDSFAVQEIISKTVAHFLMPYAGDSSSDYAGELIGVSVAASAPTELIEIKCVSNEVLGSEIYDVIGSVSGFLGTATAGIEFLSDVVNFTIPTRFPTNYNIPEDTHEGWNYEYTSASEVSPDDSSYVRTIECVQVKLGIAAKKTTLKLEYVEIPQDADGDAYSCPTIDWLEENLGLGENTELEGGDNVTDPYPIRNLVEWVDIRKKMMGQGWWVPAPGSGPIDNSAGQVPSGHLWFYKITNEFWCRMKEMAYAIYNSTVDEDVNAVLTLQDDLYDLVNSLEIHSRENRYRSPKWLTWDGGRWVFGHDLTAPFEQFGKVYRMYGSSMINYDTQLYWNMHERLWDLETTYLSKKNLPSLFAECSSESGETGSYYWKFIESPKKYLPVYSGETYYSNVYEDGAIKYTQEFGLYIAVLAGEFTEGDVIEITIDQDVLEPTIQVNDTTLLPLVARQNIDLTGGVTGNDRYLFEVKGENSDLIGADDYTLSRTSPQSYSYPTGALNPLISCFINEKDIRFGLDDTFEVNIEGGKWQSRKQVDGVWGVWSSEYNIQEAIQELENDINISFELGTYPSFVEGDTWDILATQENRVSNMLTPFNYNNLNSNGSGSIVIDLGEPKSIDVFVLGLHTITTDVLLKASDNPLFDSPYEEYTLSNSETISKVFDAPVTARYWEISTADSTQWDTISVGYLFLGSLIQLSLNADKVTPKQTWKMTSIEGKERFSLLDYRQVGFTLVYNSIQFKADYDKLITLINYVKSNGDLPFYFLPKITNSQAYRVIIDSNSWDINMPIDLDSPDDNQLYQWTIPLIGSTD